MSQFDESKIVRDSGGQFAEKPPAPEAGNVSLSGPEAQTPEELIAEHGSASEVLDWADACEVDLRDEYGFSDDEMSELQRRAALRNAPFEAVVQPQYWRGDYAMDAGHPETFDASASLRDLDEDERANLIEESRYGTLAEMGDNLYFEAVARDQVADGYGPFYVSVDEDDLKEWLIENKSWKQDGVTPHPTGGYASVEHTYNEANGTMSTSYHDAQGRSHRLDGPAFESATADGPSSYMWMKEGKLHRTDGPAKYSTDGREEYWVEGKLHRTDGPASIDPGKGREEFWVEGQYVGNSVTTTTTIEGWSIVNGRPDRDEPASPVS